MAMTGSRAKACTLTEIVARFGGEIIGDPRTCVAQIATLERARPDSIAFLANQRYLQQLKATRAGAIIVGPALRDATTLPRIVCDNPYAYFARISVFFNPPRPPVPGVHQTAVIDDSAEVGGNVEIGPFVAIGRNARIGGGSVIGAACIVGEGSVVGEEARLYGNVTIYDDCEIGDRAILHSGVVIGADGFGIAMDGERWIKVPQIGRVVIGNDVEIGANTTVDRGAMDDTVIEDGVKLDNQIQIAHNVRIGAHTAIAACVGIAGSSRVGRYCRIGGASGIAGHLTIADHVEISAHTLVTKSIDKPGTYTGAYPFEANRAWRHNAAQLRHLAELAERVRALEQRLAAQTRSGS